ncbi:hypothetical protein ATO21_06115 [Pediococcus acidilactici]|nr:hypothetical protein ATO21_06115 [Pediococcus acidilactici]
MNANKMGTKIEKKYLEKNDSGFWEDDSGARFTTNGNGKIIAIKIPFSAGGKAISHKGALASYKEHTANDLAYRSGNTYYSKKEKQYYHIEESTDSSGDVTSATIYLGK